MRVGRWKFLQHEWDLNGADDLDTFEEWMRDLPDKEVTVLRLNLHGTLSLRERARLVNLLERREALFAGLDVRDEEQLLVRPDSLDLEDFGLSGFAASAVADLRARAQGDGPEAVTARDALDLLFRLARGTPS